MHGDPPVSVVIPSYNEGDRLARTVECLLDTLPAGSEVLVIDDQSTDGSADLPSRAGLRVLQTPNRIGVVGSRNLGAASARADVLVFCDAHVEADPGWCAPLVEVLETPDVGAAALPIGPLGQGGAPGYGFTWRDSNLNVQWLGKQAESPWPVPLLCGCFLAMRRGVFVECGGFDEGLVLWGYEDAELSLRLWTLGYSCLVLPRPPVRHLFRQRFPYHVDWQVMIHNLLRVGIVHLSRARLARVIKSVSANPAFPEALARVAESDAWSRRELMRRRRRYDDGWFMDRFGIRVLD